LQGQKISSAPAFFGVRGDYQRQRALFSPSILEEAFFPFDRDSPLGFDFNIRTTFRAFQFGDIGKVSRAKSVKASVLVRNPPITGCRAVHLTLVLFCDC
jgi:hypothetical protein